MMITEQWHADIHITVELAKQCIQAQFPTLTPINNIKCIGEGWDNKVFLINEKIVFRFPRRKVAVELIERENSVLKHLQSIVTIAIPHPKYIGRPTVEYPYPFHGYDMLPGRAGCHAQLTCQERVASLIPLATFLKQLHAIDETQARMLGAKSQVYDRTHIKRTIETLIERVDKIVTRKICHIDRNVFAHEIMLIQNIQLSKDKCLVHGDLYSRHLLFHHGQLTGIIDWGDVGIGHKAVDIAAIWSFYPAFCHQQFLEIYGQVEDTTWQYARFLGLYSALTLLLYAHDTGNASLIKEAMDAAKRINSKIIR